MQTRALMSVLMASALAMGIGDAGDQNRESLSAPLLAEEGAPKSADDRETQLPDTEEHLDDFDENTDPFEESQESTQAQPRAEAEQRLSIGPSKTNEYSEDAPAKKKSLWDWLRGT